MIWFFLAAAMSFVLTAAFSILPGSELLPWPDAVPSAFGTIGTYVGFSLGLLGQELQAAVVVAAQFLISVYIIFFLFDVLRFFNIPVLDRIVGRFKSPS